MPLGAISFITRPNRDDPNCMRFVHVLPRALDITGKWMLIAHRGDVTQIPPCKSWLLILVWAKS